MQVYTLTACGAMRKRDAIRGYLEVIMASKFLKILGIL